MIWTVIIGVLAGLMAMDFSRGKAPSGSFVTCALGVVGAVLGSLVGEWAGWYRGGSALSYVMAVIGASLLLTVYNTVRRGRAR
jgi:uncharacterized membrane protein YeaQ/YmgE (transglycosylase-associated protein family)